MYNITIFGKNEIMDFSKPDQNGAIWAWPCKKVAHTQ